MYAYPGQLQQAGSSMRSWEQNQSSRRKDEQDDSTTSIFEVFRGFSEFNSQYSLKTIDDLANSQDPDASTSMSIKSTSSSFDSRNDAVGVSSTSLPTESRVSLSTTKSSVRVIGRGGSGSRLRLASINTTDLDSTILRPEQPVRPAGRGGLGSRPKPLAQETPNDDPKPKPSIVEESQTLAQETPNDDPKPKPSIVEESQTFIPPKGRGGAGSRSKSSGNGSSILTILTKRNTKSSRSLKGKEVDVPRPVHPIPPSLSYQITNASTSTLSTIHFEGETGPPEVPFFPETPSSEIASDTCSFPPQVSSSTLHRTPSSSRSTVLSGEDPLPASPTMSVRMAQRQKSLNKVARTLGVVPPPNSINTRIGETSKQNNTLPFPKSKSGRRLSLSVSSFGSLFSRSSGKVHPPVSAGRNSQHTFSTLTDDLHQFGLQDDLSESWGQIDHSARNSTWSDTPESPIIFSPPSPMVGNPNSNRPPSPAESPVMEVAALSPSETRTEEDGEYISLPSPTLSRSHSYTPVRRRRSVRLPSHRTSASLHTDIRLNSNSVALRSNWIIPPTTDNGDVAFTVSHEKPDPPQLWSGEWNSDINNVIKSLRALR